MKHHNRLAKRSHGLVFLAIVICITSAGCAGPRKTAPTVDASTLSDEGFQAYLATVDVVTVDEAYRAILILADGQDTSKTFDERKEKLESRGIARTAWSLKPQNVVDTGSIAYMICKICKFAGGIDMNVFGTLGIGDRRYALRELIYREMVMDTVAYQYVTGASLVAVMGKADSIMAKKGLYPTQGIDLSDETDRDKSGGLIVPKASEEGASKAGDTKPDGN